VAIPKIVKVKVAGIVGDKLINGPSKVDSVIKKIAIAVKFIAVWLIMSFFPSSLIFIHYETIGTHTAILMADGAKRNL